MVEGRCGTIMPSVVCLRGGGVRSRPVLAGGPAGRGSFRLVVLGRGDATQGPNRRWGIVARHRNQQEKKSYGPAGSGLERITGRGLMYRIGGVVDVVC